MTDHPQRVTAYTKTDDGRCAWVGRKLVARIYKYGVPRRVCGKLRAWYVDFEDSQRRVSTDTLKAAKAAIEHHLRFEP